MPSLRQAVGDLDVLGRSVGADLLDEHGHRNVVVETRSEQRGGSQREVGVSDCAEFPTGRAVQRPQRCRGVERCLHQPSELRLDDQCVAETISEHCAQSSGVTPDQIEIVGVVGCREDRPLQHGPGCIAAAGGILDCGTGAHHTPIVGADSVGTRSGEEVRRINPCTVRSPSGQ